LDVGGSREKEGVTKINCSELGVIFEEGEKSSNE
jgi:hypothetical protein